MDLVLTWNTGKEVIDAVGGEHNLNYNLAIFLSSFIPEINYIHFACFKDIMRPMTDTETHWCQTVDPSNYDTKVTHKKHICAPQEISGFRHLGPINKWFTGLEVSCVTIFP